MTYSELVKNDASSAEMKEYLVSGNNVSISRPKVNRDIEASQWSFDTQTVATRTEQITARVTNRSNETINGEFLLQLTSPTKVSKRISERNS